MTTVGILVVAYNAASTLAQTLDRIPREFRSEIHEVLVGDDHSQDSTHLVALGYQQTTTDLPLTIVRHPENLGYGGNQKWGYQYAIDHGWDVVVLLHGDGQYAPELLPSMIEPIVAGKAEAVFGSRIMNRGEARRGGMPAYKYVGNRILTTFQNAVVGTELTEWHSGYRAYDVRALAQLPLEVNADGFNFDTEIIIQLHEAGFRIAEIPIPTYYGDEICYVDGIGYAKDVTKDVLRYRAHKMGFGTGAKAFASSSYDIKEGDDSSHGRILRWMEMRPPSRILDLGCSDGELGARLMAMGHAVVGVDYEEHKGVRDRLVDFYQADLDHGIPDEVGERLRPRARRRRARARPVTRSGSSSTSAPGCAPAAASSRASRTSATGTRGPGWPSVASTTTPAGSSTEATSASSPAAASLAWSRRRAGRSVARSRSACRSRSPTAAAPRPVARRAAPWPRRSIGRR